MRKWILRILIGTLILLTVYGLLGYQALRTSPLNDITICALDEKGLYLPANACKAYLPVAVRNSETNETQAAFHLAVNAFDPMSTDPIDTLDVISILLANGADIDQRSSLTGYSALHAAVLFNAPRLAEFLIGSGAHVDVLDETNRLTPLQMAYQLQSNQPSVDRSSLIELLSHELQGESL